MKGNEASVDFPIRHLGKFMTLFPFNLSISFLICHLPTLSPHKQNKLFHVTAVNPICSGQFFGYFIGEGGLAFFTPSSSPKTTRDIIIRLTPALQTIGFSNITIAINLSHDLLLSTQKNRENWQVSTFLARTIFNQMLHLFSPICFKH